MKINMICPRCEEEINVRPPALSISYGPGGVRIDRVEFKCPECSTEYIIGSDYAKGGSE